VTRAEELWFWLYAFSGAGGSSASTYLQSKGLIDEKLDSLTLSARFSALLHDVVLDAAERATFLADAAPSLKVGLRHTATGRAIIYLQSSLAALEGEGTARIAAIETVLSNVVDVVRNVGGFLTATGFLAAFGAFIQAEVKPGTGIVVSAGCLTVAVGSTIFLLARDRRRLLENELGRRKAAQSAITWFLSQLQFE
jgi:hypothetical protein